MGKKIFTILVRNFCFSKPVIRPLALLDRLVWAFKGGFCVHEVVIEYVMYGTNNVHG